MAIFGMLNFRAVFFPSHLPKSHPTILLHDLYRSSKNTHQKVPNFDQPNMLFITISLQFPINHNKNSLRIVYKNNDSNQQQQRR